MFGIFIVAYLFLGGAGAGLMLVMAFTSLLFHSWHNRSFELTEAFNKLKTRSYIFGFVLIVLSLVCLIVDLGRPDRILYLFTRSTTSFLSIGTFCLTAMLVVGGFLALANSLHLSFVSARIKKTVEVLCVLVAGSVITYTGLFLQNIVAVAFWNSPLVTVLFVLSALSLGISLIFIFIPLIPDYTLMKKGLTKAHLVHVVVITLEAVVLAAFLFSTSNKVPAAGSLALLFGPDLQEWFIAGVVIMGLFIPFCAEIYALVFKRIYQLPLADMLCVAGGFALRYCIVYAGMH